MSPHLCSRNMEYQPRFVTLKSASPVNSQASPMVANEWPLSKPSTAHISMAGINPEPEAMPADRVKMPAPATLLTRLNTEAVMVALPSDFSSPPRRRNAFSFLVLSRREDLWCFRPASAPRLPASVVGRHGLPLTS